MSENGFPCGSKKVNPHASLDEEILIVYVSFSFVLRNDTTKKFEEEHKLKLIINRNEY